MEGGKKIAVVVVLVIAIVAFVGWRLKSMPSFGGAPKPPDWVLDKEYTKIQDKEPFTSMTFQLRKWKDLGQEKGKYKNPETGKYEMVTQMTCTACGEKIPVPDMPEPSPETDPAEIDDVMMNYICPRCGQKANPEGPPM